MSNMPGPAEPSTPAFGRIAIVAAALALVASTPLAAWARSTDQSLEPAIQTTEQTAQGGGANIVQVDNRLDNRLRLRGRVDLDHVHGPNAAPTNKAEAFASCTDCQTFAVALQIALIPADATTVAPENAAVAVNYRCTRCFTSARALQYVITVDDPDIVPDRVTELVHAMTTELRVIEDSGPMNPGEANARIDAVVAEFQDLAAALRDQRQDTDQPDS